MGSARLGIALALIGVATYAGQIDELIEATGGVPQANQISWGPSLYDPAVVPGLQQSRILLQGYSPVNVSNLHHPAAVLIAVRHNACAGDRRMACRARFVLIPRSVYRERIGGVRLRLPSAEVVAIDGLQ